MLLEHGEEILGAPTRINRFCALLRDLHRRDAAIAEHVQPNGVGHSTDLREQLNVSEMRSCTRLRDRRGVRRDVAAADDVAYLIRRYRTARLLQEQDLARGRVAIGKRPEWQ